MDEKMTRKLEIEKKRNDLLIERRKRAAEKLTRYEAVVRYERVRDLGISEEDRLFLEDIEMRGVVLPRGL